MHHFSLYSSLYSSFSPLATPKRNIFTAKMKFHHSSHPKELTSQLVAAGFLVGVCILCPLPSSRGSPSPNPQGYREQCLAGVGVKQKLMTRVRGFRRASVIRGPFDVTSNTSWLSGNMMPGRFSPTFRGYVIILALLQTIAAPSPVSRRTWPCRKVQDISSLTPVSRGSLTWCSRKPKEQFR